MAASRSRWIQKATSPERRGALHRMLRIPEGEKIPLAVIREAAKHPERFYHATWAQTLLRRRAQFALNVRGLGR